MRPPDQSDDLVISTPERVAFEYEVAGIGSRFLAQVVDTLVISVILIVITILAASVAGLFHAGELAILIELILTFILLVGYFLISEAAWNGQTLGKRAVRLRVVGDHGEPLTIAQAAIRNLLRIIDFLPLFYAVGIITMFANRRAKRLGDFAAGTLVVRDRQRISLYDLSSTTAQGPPPVAPPSASIWTQQAPSSGPVKPAPPPAPQGPIDPALRRLVVAYAARREMLPAVRREELARRAEGALRIALPDVVASAGPLAALDLLAEREGISAYRPVQRNASQAMGWGITALIFCWFPIIGIPTGILSIVGANRGLRAIRRQPEKFQGEDKATTGRLLGIIGLVISTLIAVLIVIGLIFAGG